MVPRQGKAFQRRLVSTGPSIDSRRFALASRFTCKSQYFCGALGRTRTCDLLIRSQTRSRTGSDREGQGETKARFYRNRVLLKGQGRTGRDTGLWYRCGTKGPLTYSIGGQDRVDTAYEDHRILSRIRITGWCAM